MFLYVLWLSLSYELLESTNQIWFFFVSSVPVTLLWWKEVLKFSINESNLIHLYKYSCHPATPNLKEYGKELLKTRHRMISYQDNFRLIFRKIYINQANSDLGVLQRVASFLILAIQGWEGRDVRKGPMQLFSSKRIFVPSDFPKYL